MPLHQKTDGGSEATRPARGSKKAQAQPPDQIDDSAGRVTLRTPDQEYQIPQEISGALATRWYYMVRNRSRWKDSHAAKQTLAVQILSKLEALGVTRGALAEILRMGFDKDFAR